MHILKINEKIYKISENDVKKISRRKPWSNHVFEINVKHNLCGEETYFFKLPTVSKGKNRFPLGIDNFEIFVPYLLNNVVGEKFGCNILHYDYAEFDGQKGAISKSFLLKGDEFYDSFWIMALNLYNKDCKTNLLLNNLSQEDKEKIEKYYSNHYFNNIQNFPFSVEKLVEDLKDICNQNKWYFDEEQVRKELNILVICDYFIFNYDRNPSNITILVNNNKNVRLAPNYDNGLSLGNFDNEIGTKIIRKPFFVINEIGTKNNFAGNKLLEKESILLLDIYELTKTNEEYREIVDSFLNLNIEDVIECFEKDKKKELPKETKEKIIDTYEKQVKKYVDFKIKLEKKINKTNTPIR